MSEDLINKTLQDIQNDIESNFDFEKIDNDSKCYISIIAEDVLSLKRAYSLIDKLSIKSKFITIKPESYKSCKYDCMTVADIFRSIKAIDDFNVNCISILSGYRLNPGEFAISILKENTSNNIMKSYTLID